MTSVINSLGELCTYRGPTLARGMIEALEPAEVQRLGDHGFEFFHYDGRQLGLNEVKRRPNMAKEISVPAGATAELQYEGGPRHGRVTSTFFDANNDVIASCVWID